MTSKPAHLTEGQKKQLTQVRDKTTEWLGEISHRVLWQMTQSRLMCSSDKEYLEEYIWQENVNIVQMNQVDQKGGGFATGVQRHKEYHWQNIYIWFSQVPLITFWMQVNQTISQVCLWMGVWDAL